MYIVHVIPITRQVGLDSFSYFTFKDIPVGSVVNVPLRKKEVPALVLRREDAGAIRALLRTQQYVAKNIKDANPRKLLSQDFVAAATETSEHFITSVGNVLNSFVPTALLKDTEAKYISALVSKNLSNTHEVLTIQTAKTERVNAYKTILRGALARGESAFLLVPTIKDTQEFKEFYAKGINKYVYTLHSSLSAKQQRETWHAILAEDHPVLIIATKGFVSIPRADIGVYIIESEGSDAYKEMMRPFVDVRILVEKLAKRTGAKLIYGDTLLTSSTQNKIATNNATELQPSSKRLRGCGKVSTVDMGEYTRKATEERKQYPILSEKVAKVLQKSDGKHTFILAARRGIASQTVCQDCGTNVLCPRCSAPMSLHSNSSGRSFLCRTCGEAKDAKTLCTHCGGWQLKPLGIGIERIEAAAKEITKVKVLRIDSSIAKTPKKIQEIITDFYTSKSAILVGTTMALPYLDNTLQTSVIPSLDSLLAIPDFAAEERAFRTILTLAEKTKGEVIIQTRSPQNKMLADAKEAAIAKFVTRELELRKKLKYPPYTTFIKISVTGSKQYCIKEVKSLLAKLRPYEPRVFREFEPARAGKYTLHTLLRFTDTWPDAKLLNLLYSLPRSFVVQIT